MVDLRSQMPSADLTPLAKMQLPLQPLIMTSLRRCSRLSRTVLSNRIESYAVILPGTVFLLNNLIIFFFHFGEEDHSFGLEGSSVCNR